MVVVVVAVSLVAAFLAITSATGMPGPDPLRRYSSAELSALVDAIHAEAGTVRTPDDCWRLREGGEGPLRDIARVDHLRSRVVVRAWASDDGILDPITRSRIRDRLAAVIARSNELERNMVLIEPSPDGWHPTVACSAVLRGPITGF